MNKRWIPFISVSVAVIFIGGMLAGSKTEASNQAALLGARLGTQTTIAVVNADTGVIDEDGERINYSAAIIDYLDEEFTQVSPALAQTGFEDGSFGAVVTFPADVSERIMTFNDRNPERVQLEFKLNPNLEEGDYIETFIRILNLQMSMNTTLSYIYVSSIFSQFHEAQNQVSNVFDNKQANIEAMSIIELHHFTGSLELDYLPEIPFEPNPFDGSNHLTSVEGFASSVASLYLGSYNQASAAYQAMRGGLFRMTDDIPYLANEWLNRLDQWSSEVSTYGNAQVDYREILAEFLEELMDYREALEGYHEAYEELLDDVIGFFNAMIIWHGQLQSNYQLLRQAHNLMAGTTSAALSATISDINQWQSDLEDYREDLMEWYDLPSWHENMTIMYNNLQSNLNATIPARPVLSDPDCPYAVEEYESQLLSWIGSVETIANDLSRTLNHIDSNLDEPLPNIISERPPTIPTASSGQLSGQLTSVGEILDQVVFGNPLTLPVLAVPYVCPTIQTPNEPEEFNGGLPISIAPPEAAEGFLDPLASLRGQLETFNVDAFLTDEVWGQVEGQLSGFSSYIEMMRGGLELHAQGNNMTLTMIYFDYVNYLVGLRQDAFAAEDREMENLRDRIEVYYDAQEVNRQDTEDRLIAFYEMLPESRTEAGINRDLVNYTVAPFEFVPPVIRSADTVTMADPTYQMIGYFLIGGITTMAVVLALTLASQKWVKDKKKKR